MFYTRHTEAILRYYPDGSRSHHGYRTVYRPTALTEFLACCGGVAALWCLFVLLWAVMP